MVSITLLLGLKSPEVLKAPQLHLLHDLPKTNGKGPQGKGRFFSIQVVPKVQTRDFPPHCN